LVKGWDSCASWSEDIVKQLMMAAIE